MTIEEKLAENAKNADIKEGVGFKKSMPTPFNPEDALKQGDVINMPAVGALRVFTQYFGEPDAKGIRPSGEFIVVNVTSTDGTVRAINWFPTSLTKNIWPAQMQPNGKVQTITANGPMNPKGTAVDLYKSFQGKGTADKTDVQLGVEALCSRAIKVTSVTPVDVQRWRKGIAVDELKSTNLFTYDL